MQVLFIPKIAELFQSQGGNRLPIFSDMCADKIQDWIVSLEAAKHFSARRSAFPGTEASHSNFNVDPSDG